MISKQFTFNAILCLLCGVAWFGLPNSVLSESHPVLTKFLLGIGTIAGAWGAYHIVKALRKQNDSTNG